LGGNERTKGITSSLSFAQINVVDEEGDDFVEISSVKRNRISRDQFPDLLIRQQTIDSVHRILPSPWIKIPG
jgi:hypothetical protein